MEDVNYEFLTITTVDGIIIGIIIGLLTQSLEFWMALCMIIGLCFGLFYPIDKNRIDFTELQ